jgi:DNA-binding GntR family transcriptional regulator
MGFSRTPIGRAIGILVREGLMESVPQVGVRVRKISAEEIDEIFAIRIALESVIARTLADRVSQTDTRPRHDNIDRTERATDAAAFLEQSTAFHFICAKLAGFTHGAAVLESLRDKLQTVGVSVTNDFDRRVQIIKEHKDIVSAIESGNPDLAAEQQINHLKASEHRMRLVSKYLS